MRSLFHIFTNRRMVALVLLGFSSGLPYALTGDTLQAWLKDAGVRIDTIGLLSLVGLPYTLKFAWAPMMDRFAVPLLGRRRGWLLVMQLLLIGAIVLMAMQSPQQSIWLVAALAMLVAFLSASQDIVFDAYRADVLDEDERGPGAAISVTGYRVAMIVSAAGALMLAQYLPWRTVYLLMSAGMLIGVIGTLFAPEPMRYAPPPVTLIDAIDHPLREFLLRRQGWIVLMFVVVFRLPDVMAGAMSQLFLLDIGHTKLEIGSIRQGLGIGVTIVGALFGGGVVTRMGLTRSLWLIALLQAISNAGFFLLAYTGRHYGTMVGVIVVENFCGGMATAGFTAFLMSQCDPRFSATQFALLTSVMALTRVIGGAPTGYLVQLLGWPWFFLLSIAASAPGLALLPWLGPSHDRDAEGRSVEDPAADSFDLVVPKRVQ